MYRLSDSDSVDSDKGIRYKTDSIRNKDKSSDTDSSSKRHNSGRRVRNRSRSRSPRSGDTKKKKGRRRTRERSDDEKKGGNSRNKERNSGREDIKRHRRKEDRKVYDIDARKKSEKATSFGPALPTKISETKDSGLERRKPVEDKVLGPALPPVAETKTVIGPSLPPNFKQKSPDVSNDPVPVDEPRAPTESNQSLSEESHGPTKNKTTVSPTKLDDETIGPAPPANLDDAQPSTSARTIGPSLPSHLRQKLLDESPVKPPEEAVSEDEAFGPVPEGATHSRAHIELEERALRMKMEQLEPGEVKPSREEWMTALPEVKASRFGLGPRQFRSKAGPDLSDRSSWTDTPEEKAKKKAGKAEPKVDIKKEAEKREIRKRDKEQEAIAKRTKKNKDSLLDIHQKKLKDGKSDGGPSERRPFSREIDLQVNRFDEAQKKAVLSKAQLLDTRFSTGESKFL